MTRSLSTHLLRDDPDNEAVGHFGEDLVNKKLFNLVVHLHIVLQALRNYFFKFIGAVC